MLGNGSKEPTCDDATRLRQRSQQQLLIEGKLKLCPTGVKTLVISVVTLKKGDWFFRHKCQVSLIASTDWQRRALSFRNTYSALCCVSLRTTLDSLTRGFVHRGSLVCV